MMSSNKSVVFSIAVTPSVRSAFAHLDIHGKGGFQSLMRGVAEKVTSAGSVVKFSADEFDRIARYATTYGEGGFQQKLRMLLALWTAQNLKVLHS